MKNVRFTISQLEFTDDNFARLWMVNNDDPAIQADKTQAEFENVIRENAPDDELYHDWMELEKSPTNA